MKRFSGLLAIVCLAVVALLSSAVPARAGSCLTGVGTVVHQRFNNRFGTGFYNGFNNVGNFAVPFVPFVPTQLIAVSQSSFYNASAAGLAGYQAPLQTVAAPLQVPVQEETVAVQPPVQTFQAPQVIQTVVTPPPVIQTVEEVLLPVATNYGVSGNFRLSRAGGFRLGRGVLPGFPRR